MLFHGVNLRPIKFKLERSDQYTCICSKKCHFPRGGLYSDSAWWYYLKKRIKKLNIENANLYTFRHTFASWLAMEGVEMRTIAEFLGHLRIETTMINAHLVPEHVKRAVERLPGLSE